MADDDIKISASVPAETVQQAAFAGGTGGKSALVAGGVVAVGGIGLGLWLWLRGLKPQPAVYAIFGEMNLPLVPGPQVVYSIFGEMTIPLEPGPQVVYSIFGEMTIPLEPGPQVVYAVYGEMLLSLAPPPPAVVYAIYGEINLPMEPTEYIEGYILSTGIFPATAPAAILVSPDKPYYDWGEEVVVMCTWSGFWEFLYWEVDGLYNSSPSNGLYLTMYGNHSVVAHLQASQAGTYTISVIAGDVGVSTNPAPGQYILAAGEEVSLYAWTDDPELTEAYWVVNGVEYDQAEITLIADRDITAIARMKFIYV